jgi:hypothetical protein
MGGAAVGAAIGRSGWRPGLLAQGGLLAAGSFGAAAALAALPAAQPFLFILAVIGGAQLALGVLAALVTLADLKGKIDFKNHPAGRFAARMLISGGLASAAFAGLAGYLFFAMAGTIKDKAGDKIFPMHDGAAPLYAKAAAAAMKAAEGKGYKAENLYLADMEARDPMDSQKGWTVQFIAKKSPDATKGEVINAYLYPGRTEGSWTASAYAYGETEVGDAKLLKFMLDIKRATTKNLGDALAKAAKALKVEPAELGLSVQPWRDDDAWGTDLAYVFDTVDGRRWGMNARTGKVLSLPDTGVSVARIEAAAKSVASYKGRPWSQTEYNMTESMTGDSLRRDGASPAQMRLFQKLCDAAPVRGGGFNPWSGD